MKILLLTDGIFPYVVGGMQKHSSYLAKFLAIAGHDVTVAHCVPMGKPAPDTNAVKDMLGLNDAHMLRSVCISFPKAGWMPGHYLKESYLYSRQLFDIFKASLTQYDFIYAKGFSAWYLLQKKSRGMTLPAVGIKFHGYEMFQIAAGWRTRLEHWMLRGPVKWNTLHADVVFSYGGKITGLIRDLGVDAERIAEIPTGIEQAWLSNNIIPSRGPVRFVFVGRDERRKGMPELIEVLKSPGTANPFEFEFVGPVNASNRVNAPHIKYHGIVTGQKALQGILDQCHVMVVPSWSEGMPNVIMEGMARGLAIVATDVGAVQALVTEKNGRLISPGSVADLRRALVQMTEVSAAQLDQMRHHSRQHVETFVWERVVKMVEKQIAQRKH